MGVKIKYSELEPLKAELESIIDEFDHAGARRKDLMGAIKTPYGESALRDAADDFEGRWDDRRKRLMGNCETVRDYVESIIQGFQEFDEEAGSMTESDS
ncbi:hypothetical protein [Microbacterium sp. YY-01]|uniref:hypothetical protein n=1 Tax=Microbacterium sp. YY-01 TaxID=3421634 RepID=UPI003D165C9C